MKRPKVWDKHDEDMPYEAIPDRFYDADEVDAFLEEQAAKLEACFHPKTCVCEYCKLGVLLCEAEDLFKVVAALRGKAKEKEARG